MNQAPPFSENDLRSAIAEATSWAQTQRLLGYAVKGANHRTVQRWARHWGISTGHFDPNLGRREACRARAIPLEEVLVENSSYHRGQLKARLLRSGLKQRVCELCGQDELWHGQRMSLVLDHVNGVPDDHLSELRRDVGDTLRSPPAARAYVPGLRPGVCSPQRSAPLLLATVLGEGL